MGSTRDTTTLAVRLYADLHSSARENFVSSLLTASLNECQELRRWLVYDKAELDKRRKLKAEHFHASAADTIPELIRGRGNYTYADILVWYRPEEKLWESLEKGEKQNLDKVHAVFIEVKHTSLSEPDKKKYEDFIKKIRGKPKLKFIIISEHSPNAADRLTGGSGSAMKTTNDKLWRDLLHNQGDQIKHMTVEEILDAANRKGCKKRDYLVLDLLREYLRIAAKPSDEQYWKHLLAYYTKLPKYELKVREEIFSAALAIAARWGLTCRKRLPITDVEGLLVDVNKTGGYSLKVMKQRSRNTGELEVDFSKIGGKAIRFPKGMKQPKTIAKKMEEIDEAFKTLWARGNLDSGAHPA